MRRILKLQNCERARRVVYLAFIFFSYVNWMSSENLAGCRSLQVD